MPVGAGPHAGRASSTRLAGSSAGFLPTAMGADLRMNCRACTASVTERGR